MSGGSEMELNNGALEFMKKFVSGHRIVATGELTGLQIAEARSDGRFYAEPDGGLGWVALPWHLSTVQDKARESNMISGWQD